MLTFSGTYIIIPMGACIFDIKFGFKVQFAYLMEILAADWGLAPKAAEPGAGTWSNSGREAPL